MSNIELLYTVVTVCLIVLGVCYLWCPEETKPGETTGTARKLLPKPKCVDKEGFEDHFGSAGQMLKFWQKCDKCKQSFLKSELLYQKSIDEYFCENCAGLAKIYMGEVSDEYKKDADNK